MKFFSKITTVVLITVGAAGTLGGAIMFGVGGAPTAKLSFNDNPEKTVGVGWLNFDSKAFQGISYDDFLKTGRDNQAGLKTGITETEASIQKLEAELATLNPDTEAGQIATIKGQIANSKAEIKVLKVNLNAAVLFDLAIAGIIVMSVGILIAALSAAMAINVENSEDRKLAKKNKVEINN